MVVLDVTCPLRVTVMQLLLISLLTGILWLLAVNGVPTLSLKERVEMNQPTDLQLSPQRLGEFMFTWVGNFSGLNRTHDFYYLLHYRYLDSKEESSIMLKDHYFLKNWELYRGAFARVKLQLEIEGNKISSNWTEMTFIPFCEEFASIENLLCAFYNTDYMNCTWDISKSAPQDAKFVLSYRADQQSETHPCEKYHTQVGRNTGCYSQKYNGDLYEKGIICVSETRKPKTYPLCREITPRSFYILKPPTNIKIKSPRNLVTWELGEDTYLMTCYTFQINIIDWRDNTSMVQNVSSTRFAISTNPSKGFSVRVRATTTLECSESFLWSEWSRTVTREPEAEELSHSAVMMLAVVCFAGMVLPIAFIFKRCRLWEKLYQPIPDPKHLFKGLYENYNGDFQKWIKSLPMTEKNEECITVTVKEDEYSTPGLEGQPTLYRFNNESNPCI